MSELLKISLDQIRENPVALRSVEKEGEEYIRIRDSIAARGILNPINVLKKVDPDNNIYYVVVDGLHRYTSAVELGLGEIPAHVLDADESEVTALQIIANSAKKETKPVEYTKALKLMLTANPTLTINELADQVGNSAAWVSSRLNLLKLDEKIQKLVDDGRVSVTNAIALSKLPKEEQPEYLDRAMTQTPSEFVPTVDDRVKALRTAAREGRKADEIGFVPTQFLRKVSEFKDELESGRAGGAVTARLNLTTAAEGFKAGVEWALHVDPQGLDAQRAKYDALQAEKAAKKAAREAEKEAKKNTEAAEAAVAAAA